MNGFTDFTASTVDITLSESEAYLTKTVCERIANDRRIMHDDIDEIRYSSQIFNLSGSEIMGLYEIVRKIRISLGCK